MLSKSLYSPTLVLFLLILFIYLAKSYGVCNQVVPRPGIETLLPAVEVRSLNHRLDCQGSPCPQFKKY